MIQYDGVYLLGDYLDRTWAAWNPRLGHAVIGSGAFFDSPSTPFEDLCE